MERNPKAERKLSSRLWTIFRPFLNWRFAITFGLAWMIVNGWSYISLAIGVTMGIPWLTSIASAYVAFLYLPFTEEKLIIIPLAILFHKLMFRNDRTTRKQLEEMNAEVQSDWKTLKTKIKNIFRRIDTHNMKTSNTKIIGETFQEISDIVTGTMGAKGKLAVIADEFSRPFLTDDGVTVAKECLNQDDPFKKMVATSMIEAANNTEKSAFDGTTLTVLMTNELYKAGAKLIKHGMHPQEAAYRIEQDCHIAINELKMNAIRITEGKNDEFVKDVANITTKIPAIGELVYKAYKSAGPEMNIIIEHDRKSSESTIEHVDGMVIDSGYFSDELKQLCDEEGKYTAENARIILLSEGVLTPIGMKTLFGSITNPATPLIFVLDKGFNPDCLNKLMNTLVDNKLHFMFVFINDSKPDEIFLDIAAKTGGQIQSNTFGTTDYCLDYAGTAAKIIIEQSKTTIIAEGNKEAIDKRLAAYRKELDDNRYTTGYIRADTINRRMSNLDKGVTKIKLATSTSTEFRTIRFKLDDAIGAVRCACKTGILIGAGKTLYLISKDMVYTKEAFQSPALTIIRNSGYKVPSKKILESKEDGLDVKTGQIVNLRDAGIIDSYASITQAIMNAESIATSYLKSYILINAHA